jgi:gas vesicle protein
MPKEVSQKTKLYFAIAAGVLTAITSSIVLQTVEGALAHATTQELHEMSEECRREMIELKKAQEKAVAEREQADARLMEAQAELAEAIQKHITQDVKDTENIKTNMEWIRRGVDRLMKDKVLKPEYR